MQRRSFVTALAGGAREGLDLTLAHSTPVPAPWTTQCGYATINGLEMERGCAAGGTWRHLPPGCARRATAGSALRDTARGRTSTGRTLRRATHHGHIQTRCGVVDFARCRSTT